VRLFDRKSPGSGCRRPKTRGHSTFYFLQGRSLQETVTWQEMMAHDLWWQKVTRNWRHLAGSHLKVAVEGQKLAYTLHFISYKAVSCRRRQSRDRKSRPWPHWIGSDPEVTSFDRKSPGSSCTKVKTRLLCTFFYLQGCSSQEEAGTDRKWHYVTYGDREWRNLPEFTWKWL